MTKEDAIRMAQGLITYFKSESETMVEFCNVVVKVLEREPCEDAISRDELLKTIDTWDKFGCDADTKLVPYQDHYVPYIHYDDVVKCIKGMPSVTPQPKTRQRLCRTCIYGDKTEYDKPCIIYSDNCQLFRADDVLDKIRAEIEEIELNITYQENKDRKATWGLRKALEIIDKYKAESEEEE